MTYGRGGRSGAGGGSGLVRGTRAARGRGGGGGAGSSNGGEGGGSRGSSGGGRARRAGGGTGAGGEVDARHVGLAGLSRVPPPLENAVAGGAAVGGEGVGESDGEGGVVGGDTGLGGGVVGEGDQGLANDGVGGGVDDGDVGNTGVGSADLNLEVDGLTRGVALDVGVVGELVTLAEGELALGGVEAAAGLLGEALDVAVRVGLLGVPHGGAASLLESITGDTGSGRGDLAVGRDGGDERENGDDLGLHLERFRC